jgi:ribonucleoside-diphosphate reductase beta chain
MKTLLNCDEPYNLSPMQYPWAFEQYKQARKNFWNPEQVNMTRDIASFQTLTEAEQAMFLDVFATLTTADLAIQENLSTRIYDTLQPPEIRLWLGHQAADEALHSYSYQHIIECLSLDDASIYQRYKQRPYLLQKFELGNTYARMIQSDDALDTVLGLTFFWIAWEGLWFYHGFTPILALGRQGKMQGTCEQLLYIARDEYGHFSFGLRLIVELIRELGLENDRVLHTRLSELFTSVYRAEEIYAQQVIQPLLGYSAQVHLDHMRFLIKTRLQQLGVDVTLYPQAENAIPWLSEMLEMKKERNFFETHVTEYQSGARLEFERVSLDDISNWTKVDTVKVNS